MRVTNSRPAFAPFGRNNCGEFTHSFSRRRHDRLLPLKHPTSPYVEPRDRALALLTLDELRTLESRAAASLPANTLMARAGAAAAQFVIDQNRHAPNLAALPVWIVAGPGNNGGDALVMAARLRQAGIDVEVCMPVEVKPDDARWALDEARQAGVEDHRRRRPLPSITSAGSSTACSASASDGRWKACSRSSPRACRSARRRAAACSRSISRAACRATPASRSAAAPTAARRPCAPRTRSRSSARSRAFSPAMAAI